VTRATTRRRATIAPIALLLALVAAWLAPVAGFGAAPTAFAAATDLTLVADSVYTIQPAQHRVHVVLDLTARNNTRETKARRFYFDHAFLAVLPNATNLKISGTRGGRVSVRSRSKDSTLLRIDFGSRLYSGKRRSFTVSFDLVDKGTPANRALRVGPTLVTLPVWAHATNGAKGGSVTVRIPAGYEHAVETGHFDSVKTAANGSTELRTKALSKPLDFFAYVSAQKPATYSDTPLDVPTGDESVSLVLKGWKDDAAWTERVGGLFTKSLPVLREEIGLPWPHAEPLTVQEAVSRSAGGYAGLFDPSESRVEVAYWADRLVVIHEAAHGWFNGALLADRWANEGFASLYAERAAKALDESAAGPTLTKELKAAAIPLNAWAAQPAPSDDGSGGTPGGSTAGSKADAAARATEGYGYAASLELARAIAERAGDDALRLAWADAAAKVGGYQPGDVGLAASTAAAGGATPPETLDAPADWRGLLDILERRTGKDFTDLWRQSVVRPEDAPLLDARAAARASYQRTLALAGDWALPRGIRDALRTWQFDAAERLLADARTVLAQRNAVADLAAREGVTLPADMQTEFEAGSLVDASGRAEAERNAIRAISGAAAAKSAGTDPLTAIGMLGEDPDADLVAARTSLGTGDVQASLDASDDAFRAWTGAWQEGRRRALLAVAVLATIIVLGSAVVGRARTARSERVAAASAGLPATSTTTAPMAPAPPPEPTAEELLAAGTPRFPDVPGEGDRTHA
jgi:hypothetical protein